MLNDRIGPNYYIINYIFMPARPSSKWLIVGWNTSWAKHTPTSSLRKQYLPSSVLKVQILELSVFKRWFAKIPSIHLTCWRIWLLPFQTTVHILVGNWEYSLFMFLFSSLGSEHSHFFSTIIKERIQPVDSSFLQMIVFDVMFCNSSSSLPFKVGELFM